MKSFAVLALFASLVAQGYAVMINTPASIVQCQPVLLSWSDGTAPYFPSVLPGGQPSAAALKTFDSTDATQLTWNVDLPAGTSITLALRDSTGEQVFSDAVTIASSSDSSCVNASVAESASGASGATDSAAPSAASGPATTGSGTSSAATRATSQASGAATGTADSSTDSASSAVRGATMNAAGIAGLLGFIGAALL